MHYFFEKLKFNHEIAYRFATEIIGKAATFILALLLARGLGVSGFAAIGNANLIVAAILPVLSFGLSFTLVRVTASLVSEQAVAKHYYTSLLIAGVAAILFSTILWNVSSFVAIQLFDNVIWHLFVKLVCIYCIFTVLELITLETLRARQLIKSASYLQISMAIVNLNLCLFLDHSNLLTPNSALGVLISTRGITALFAHIILVANKQVTLTLHLCNLEEAQKALILGAPFAASGFGTWMIEHGDRFVITTFMKQTDFGPYLGAITILSVISICGAPFWYLLFPKMAKAFGESDKLNFRNEAKKAMTNYSLIVLPVVIFITVSLPDLLPVLAGKDFAIDHQTSLALAISILAIQLGSPWEYACIVSGYSKKYLKNTLFFGLLGVLLGAIFIQYWGVFGAALSAIISRAGLSYSLFLLSSQIGAGKSLLPDFRHIFSIFTASIPASLFCIYILQQEFMKQNNMIITISAYCLSFIPILAIYYSSYKIFLRAFDTLKSIHSKE